MTNSTLKFPYSLIFFFSFFLFFIWLRRLNFSTFFWIAGPVMVPTDIYHRSFGGTRQNMHISKSYPSFKEKLEDPNSKWIKNEKKTSPGIITRSISDLNSEPTRSGTTLVCGPRPPVAIHSCYAFPDAMTFEAPLKCIR